MKVMDLVVRMGYDEVYLLGFDGYSTPHHYFYEDPAFYPEESRAWKEAIAASLRIKGKGTDADGWALETGGNLFEVNATASTKIEKNGYEKVLAAFAMYNGIRLINLSAKSTLSQYVYTKSISEALQGLEA